MYTIFFEGVLSKKKMANKHSVGVSVFLGCSFNLFF